MYVLLFINGNVIHTLFLQVNGVEKIHPVGPVSAEEQKLIEACLPELKKNIEKGKAFASQ